LGIAQHQTGVQRYGLTSFLMGYAHPTGFSRYIAPRCNILSGALRHIQDSRTISRAVLFCFLRIDGNHIFFFVIATKAQQPPSVLERRHGFDEASHSRASPNMDNNAISRTPGFLPSQE
jgi:hypothetical protein